MSLTLPGILSDFARGGATIPRRTLGRTGLSVSILGCGYTVVKDAAFFRRAFERGINNFLLSPANLEACAAVRPFRNQVVTTCLLGAKDTRQEMTADLDDFLRRSGLDHVDVWYIAVPTTTQFNPLHEAVAAAREAGKARFAAITTHRLAENLPRLVSPDSPIDVVMIQYNGASPADVQEQIARLHAAGLGITPMKSASGAFDRELIGSKAILASVRWVAADKRISCVPLRMESLDELEQDVQAISLPFSDEDRKVLGQVRASVSSRLCRMCGGCDGKCARGLAVSDLVRCAMYLEGYRDPALAREQFQGIPAPVRDPRCEGCRQCTIECPNGVLVPQRVRLAQAALAFSSHC
jgi:predicted aldo/keto reductase-like oxidoreductase